MYVFAACAAAPAPYGLTVRVWKSGTGGPGTVLFDSSARTATPCPATPRTCGTATRPTRTATTSSAPLPAGSTRTRARRTGRSSSRSTTGWSRRGCGPQTPPGRPNALVDARRPATPAPRRSHCSTRCAGSANGGSSTWPSAPAYAARSSGACRGATSAGRAGFGCLPLSQREQGALDPGDRRPPACLGGDRGARRRRRVRDPGSALPRPPATTASGATTPPLRPRSRRSGVS
jgi:hypothetical protein